MVTRFAIPDGGRRLAVALAFGAAACATVVDLEVARPGSEGPTDRDGNDSGVADPPDSAPDAGRVASSACGCDAGAGCCLPQSGASSCVANDPTACPGGATSMFLACLRSDENGRDCCWNEAGDLAKTTWGASCTRAACLADADCAAFGGSCQILSCRGMQVGVCAGSLGALNCIP